MTKACGVPGRFLNVLATAWSGFIPQPDTAVADTTIKGQGEFSHPQFGGDLRGSCEVVLPARQHVCGCVRQASLEPS
jgi:hypothetical protein